MNLRLEIEIKDLFNRLWPSVLCAIKFSMYISQKQNKKIKCSIYYLQKFDKNDRGNSIVNNKTRFFKV